MGITTRRSGTPVRFNPEKAARIIAGFVPGAILLRTDKGIDANGEAFKQYTSSYRKTLAKMGEGIDANGEAFKPYTSSYRRTLAKMGEGQKIDLRLTGGLMNSVKVRGKSISADGVSVTVAPDTGTSAQVAPVKGRAKRTGERGPPHNVLGYWLHHGTAHMRARPFMGLSPAQRDELNMLLAKAGLWG